MVVATDENDLFGLIGLQLSFFDLNSVSIYVIRG
jgi:hypothetical protein